MLLGIAIDGGKDSLSMAAKVNSEIVKSPGTLVISGYVGSPDITKTVTPNIKFPGHSKLLFLDLASGRTRLGTTFPHLLSLIPHLQVRLP